jgi:hypothetical protein
MNPTFLLLPLAILCLWTPSAVLSSAKIREKLRNPIRRRDEGMMSLIRCGLNWVDLARSAFGGWLLQHEVLMFRAGQDDLAMVHTVVQLAVLFVAVLAQTIWIDRPLRIIGPTFFIAGLTLAVCGPMIGGFGLILGFACALMLRRLSLSFIFVPVCLVGFGLLFHKLSTLVLFNAAIFALPTLLAFAFGVRVSYVRRPLDSQNRRKGSGHAEIAPQDDSDGLSILSSNAPRKNMSDDAGAGSASEVINLEELAPMTSQKRSA